MADPKPIQTIVEPRFTNIARIRHTRSEFYLDFALQSLDHQGTASIIAALVLTPPHAKELLRALSSNIQKFESANGEIVVPDPPAKESVQ